MEFSKFKDEEDGWKEESLSLSEGNTQRMVESPLIKARALESLKNFQENHSLTSL